MSSLLKQLISSKISHVVNQSRSIDNVNGLSEKLFYLTKLNRVDKNTREFGLFSLNLKPISHEIASVDWNQFKDFPKDDAIESIHFDKASQKLLIKTNFHLLKQNVLRDIFNKKAYYGFELRKDELYAKKLGLNNRIEWKPKLAEGQRKTIVEFSSPNIAKPLHAGHMRSTFLGNFLSNLHEHLGHSVTRINYLGDWGTQYGILAVGFKKYGSFDKLNESPIKHLLDVYVKANKDESLKSEALCYFSDMESKKEETLKMWKMFKELSVKELDEVYKLLDVKFDSYEAESQYFEAGKLWVKLMCEKNLAQKLENGTVQVIIDEPTTGSKPIKFIVQKSDNSTLYITRDIAALFERKKVYGFSKIVYVVDSSQQEHFRNLYETVRKLDQDVLKDISFNEFYVPFGRLTNMSTRRGKVEFLSDLIFEAKHVAFESMELSKKRKDLDKAEAEYVAQNIGNSHLIITDMARPRLKDYEFSWAKIVSKDDSAYMCHYAHARLYSLLSKCKEELKIEPSVENVNLELLKLPIESVLVQHLARFDEAVWQAYEEYEPYHIVIYLFQLVYDMHIFREDIF